MNDLASKAFDYLNLELFREYVEQEIKGQIHGQTKGSKMKVWTRNEIVHLLNSNDKAVERAIVRIYYNQTAEEQVSHQTKIRNNKGFNKVHDKKGSYYAKWVLQGNRLSGKYLEDARNMAIFYSKQLVEIANRGE